MGSYSNLSDKGFNESFESQIYVDKTMLIAQINVVVNTKQKFVCVSRPRGSASPWLRICCRLITAAEWSLRNVRIFHSRNHAKPINTR